jgi:hypothetical protein
LLLVCLFTFVTFTSAFTEPITCDLRIEDFCTIDGGIFAVAETKSTAEQPPSTVAQVPEPATMALVAIGLLTLARRLGKRRNQTGSGVQIPN